MAVARLEPFGLVILIALLIILPMLGAHCALRDGPLKHIELEPGTAPLFDIHPAKSLDQHPCCSLKDRFSLVWVIQ